MPQPSRCSSVRPPRSLKPANEKSRVAGLLLFIASNWHMVRGLHQDITVQGNSNGWGGVQEGMFAHIHMRCIALTSDDLFVKRISNGESIRSRFLEPRLFCTLWQRCYPRGSRVAAMQRSHHAISRPEKLSGPFVACNPSWHQRLAR